MPLFSDTLKRYSKPHVLILVEIIEKANNVPVVKIQFEIDQKGKHTKKIIVNKLLLKDQPIKKKTASQIDEIQYYNQYCTENCIHRYSLLQLAQEAVMDEPRLQPISYKDKSLPFDTEDSDSGSYMVEVREFNNWRKFLEEIQGIRKDNTNVLKSEQKINLILGGMDAIEHSADQAVKNRDCLFQYIEELISKLS